tara:strand:- start:23 stop:496 length:474 start_codon:yes stop_codon:yes gene_type:complete
MPGIKHLIECHCFLTIYKKGRKMINHKFPVYSKIDDQGLIIPKLVKCNNCEAAHYVSSIGRSELRPGKDQTDTVMKKEDFRHDLPDKFFNYLIENNCNLADFEHVKDIIEEKRWGENVVIRRDIVDEKQQIKYITINNKNSFQINSDIIEDLIVSYE